MSEIVKLNQGWGVLQDSDNLGEKLKIWESDFEFDRCSHLISNWEKIDRLAALQVVFAENPYYGRELRYFNNAPWWYCNDFDIEVKEESRYVLTFSTVDYYMKAWLNGKFIGEHEGYFDPIEIDVSDCVEEHNHLVVKVWAPWDTEILAKAESMRCYSVKREMIKGTYEHADGFIQRDVNPVGITGPVTLKASARNALLEDSIEISSDVSENFKTGHVSVSGCALKSGDSIHLMVLDENGVVVSEAHSESGYFNFDVDIADPQLWNVWERGDAYLYTIRLELISDSAVVDKFSRRIGFRKCTVERNEEITRFYLNGKRIYLRGTSYFADVYMSEMSKERYYKDLILIKEAGFNAVRVHVHVEKNDFYDLCDELGLLVIQDSDFNWEHPTSAEWIDRASSVFRRMVHMLKSHPSIICWIVLNEPDVWKIFTGGILEQTADDDLMLKNLCDKLLSTLKEIDSSRIFIKASREEDDPDSGDTHNYTGSLATGTRYTDIAGTTEKLNTEFGMDIPSIEQSLFHDRKIFNRLSPVIHKLDELQHYQYKLIKYYIEHYRLMKYSPCSGYFQFMFIDLCPQSFYGVFDYYGMPKKGYKACLESGSPVGVFASNDNGEGFDIVLVNDLLKKYEGQVTWSLTKDGVSVLHGQCDVSCDEDSIVTVAHVAADEYVGLDLNLGFLDFNGKCISKNHYEGLFAELPHIEGHALELDNEIGMRLFHRTK